ncbi:MAG: tetratricopeptide repeat protein [Verrucomicrobiota bacterium]
MPGQVAIKNAKPDALAVFTDRTEQQQVLRKVLGPAPGSVLGKSWLVTQFYGVGGVGKSTLCRRACEIAATEFKEDVVVAVTSFDDDRWREGSVFTEVCAELCRCLVERKVMPQLTVGILMLHGQQTGRNGDPAGGLDAGWARAFVAMDRGVNAANIPGLSLVVDGLKWWREHSHRQTLQERLKSLGLWPEEQYGKLNIPDLEKKLSQALYYDVIDWLKDNPKFHLRLILDGFERLQSRERREDSQKRIQEFIGYFAGTLEPEACGRFRALLFGREKLRWDELYQDPGWNDYWTQHLLGGLAEKDAKDFLGKTQTWLRSHGQGPLADALARNEREILDASDENVHGQRVFYPFYLNLAVELVERARQQGNDPDLGRAPAELQDRFFRYLDKRELRALKILALSEVFDESLYDWLAKERLIDYPVHSFHTDLRQEHSYFQQVEGRPGDWRFHRLFEDALHAHWQSNEAERVEGRQVITSLLDYYGTPLKQKPERDWTEAVAESWRRGMEIIVTQGPELGLLQLEEWKTLLRAEPWSIEHFCDLEMRENFTRRILNESKRILGNKHPFTLNVIGTLAWLLNENAKYDEAEEQFRQHLEGWEQLVGPDHQVTLNCASHLGLFLHYKKADYNGAEPLLCRVVLGRKKLLGLEHLDTLDSIKNLASLLRDKADYAGAVALYQQVIESQEKTLGSEHPETRKSCRDLGLTYKMMGDCKKAEALYRRAGKTMQDIWQRDLEDAEKTLGPYHPSALYSAHLLGLFLYGNGDNEGAGRLLRRALVGFEKTLGPEHPSTLGVAQSVGVLLHTMGDNEAAEVLLRRSLAGFDKILGFEHPDSLRSVEHLASLLEDKTDYNGAEVLRRRALADSDKAFGPEHPDTLNRVTNLAHVLSDKGDYEGAEALFRRALAGYERVLGHEHPDTLYGCCFLGKLLSVNCDYTGAEYLYRQALLGREKTLGPEDPVTLKTVICLGIVLHNQGNHDAAEPLYRRALVSYEKLLGPEHSDTLACVDGLAYVLKAKGNFQSGLALLKRYSASEQGRTVLRYTTACLEALIGNMEGAKCLIAEEIAARPAAHEQALKDDDLKPIHDFIQKTLPT